MLPGRSKESGQSSQVCAECAELFDAEELIPSTNALVVHLLQSFLMSARFAAMSYRRVKRSHLLKGVREYLSCMLEMFVETIVRCFPSIRVFSHKLLAEMLTNQ